jgi:group I intron endonuclease
MNPGIYQIRNAVTDRRYIGEGQCIDARFKQHRADLVRGKHFNAALQADWSAYGPEAFSFEPIATIADVGDRLEVERIAIAAMLGPGAYNRAPVGPPSSIGKKRSQEHIAAIRAAQAGNKHSLGRRMTEEHKAALRAAFCGKPRSAEVRAKISAACAGKRHGPLSAEHCAAVSRGRTGVRLSDETKAERKARMIARGTWGKTHV